ncbi:MAG: S9 family peptidase [Candidatus Aminicenantes bacterium]|nr:S9 family peptidase [Candidatus Aminicenantes bacterium]
MKRFPTISVWLCISIIFPVYSQLHTENESGQKHFNPSDVFQLEYVSDPQISQDGKKIVYVRNSMNIMTDGIDSTLWMINFDGTDNRPLTSGNKNCFSPKWSPDGTKLLFISTSEGSGQIFLRWMDTGQEAKLVSLQRPPQNLAWSPDQKWIAFTIFVPDPAEPFVKMPPKPNGAEWAKPAVYIDQLQYRFDGLGYIPKGKTQIFILPVEGGTPRQVTFDAANNGDSLDWTADGKSIIFSANRTEDWEFTPQNSDIYKLDISDGKITRLTERFGPDREPLVSPDGKKIALTGYDDRITGYQLTKLYVMDIEGKSKRVIADHFGRSIGGHRWSGDSNGLYFQYDTEGNTKIAYASLEGKVDTLCGDVGGLSLGRPYSGGLFSVSKNGRIAFTQTQPDHPADLAICEKGRTGYTRLTHVNDDLLGHKTLGPVEEIWFESSYDKRKIQGWIIKPPDFDSNEKYPLILEIHGGPYANYGNRFSAEMQLYASAGYAVLYINPRGSTSYGEEFGNLIHRNYPGQDYDDLMSGVDAAIAKGSIDAKNLFVTGGSGGGVLSSWIVGKTNRFAAAVVAKPIINWYSWALTADMYTFFFKYWMPGLPWECPEEYLKISSITYVGNVTTPTMLLTGEEDYRTPISESEQFYQALKLRKIDTALVRFPGASHSIASKPSRLISKAAHIIGWFEKHSKE